MGGWVEVREGEAVSRLRTCGVVTKTELGDVLSLRSEGSVYVPDWAWELAQALPRQDISLLRWTLDYVRQGRAHDVVLDSDERLLAVRAAVRMGPGVVAGLVAETWTTYERRKSALRISAVAPIARRVRDEGGKRYAENAR